MSLWTPDGERPIPPRSTSEPAAARSDAAEPALDPEQQAQAEAMARELAQARARLLDTEVSAVLANHAMGIYELAAIHLTADEPKMGEAELAIDALAGLLSELKGRLGEAEATLRDALHQIRMAYVQRNDQLAKAADAARSADSEAEPAPE